MQTCSISPLFSINLIAVTHRNIPTRFRREAKPLAMAFLVAGLTPLFNETFAGPSSSKVTVLAPLVVVANVSRSDPPEHATEIFGDCVVILLA
jgi:hypothetical protein